MEDAKKQELVAPYFAKQSIHLAIRIFNELDSDNRSDFKILDFGCGNGSSVGSAIDMGFDAYGCDIKFKDGTDVDRLESNGRIRLIENGSYRIPYRENFFDYIVSSQVMEHVKDYQMVLAELRRVLKPGGKVLHFFPSRLRPIESHVFVPFASVIRVDSWLLFWAAIGVRKPSQTGLGIREIARDNKQYLEESTNYLAGRALITEHTQFFHRAEFVERLFLKNSPNPRGRRLYRIGVCCPIAFRLYRVFWNRVLLAS